MPNKTNNKSNKQKNNAQTNQIKASQANYGSGTKVVRKAPKVTFSSNGNCVVSHMEYICDVSSSLDFVSRSRRLNPQDPGTFTWLSAIATRFEFYKFRKLSVHYRPSCSTATDGFVIVGVDFDAYDEAPSKVSMLAWKSSTKAAFWQEIDLDVSSQLSSLPLKYADTASPGDERVSDLGKLWIATDQGTTVKCRGEIFVQYVVEFQQPSYKIPPALYYAMDQQLGSFTTAAGPFTRDKIDKNGYGNLKVEYVQPGGYKISTPGQYRLEHIGLGASVAGNIDHTITAASDEPDTNFVTYASEKFFNSTTAFNGFDVHLTSGSIVVSLTIPAITGLLFRVMTRKGAAGV